MFHFSSLWEYDYDKICLEFSNAELDSPLIVRDVRTTAYAAARAYNLTPSCYLNFLADQCRDFKGIFVDQFGFETYPNIERVFEASEKALFSSGGDAEKHIESVRKWFKEWCCSPPSPSYKRQPHVKCEARERVRVVATILRASFPEIARSWGARPYGDFPQE